MTNIILKMKQFLERRSSACVISSLIIIVTLYIAGESVLTSSLNDENNNNVLFSSLDTTAQFLHDGDKVEKFLHSNVLNIMSVEAPDYMPNLASPCFYEHASGNNSKYWSVSGSALRCLPRIILSGFDKCGTSELHQYITQHQHIMPTPAKELHLWSSRGGRMTMRHYTDLFNHSTSVIENCCLRRKRRCKVTHSFPAEAVKAMNIRQATNFVKQQSKSIKQMETKIQENRLDDSSVVNNHTCPFMLMESTPRYVWDWPDDPVNTNTEYASITAADRIRHVIPNARTIISMRRPENRLWSDYHFCQQFNPELAGVASADHFHARVEEAIDWWNNCLEIYSMEQCAYGLEYKDIQSLSAQKVWGNSISSVVRLRVSIYFVYVKKWLEVFKQENVLFVRFEDFIENPTFYVTSRVYPFLGLEKLSSSASKRMKGFSHGKKHTASYSMHNKTRTLLVGFFKPYNAMLADLLHNKRFLWEDV